MIALGTYNLILSFPKEVICIWRRGFGPGMVLYLSIRYGTILYILFQVLNTGIVVGNVAVSINMVLWR